MKIFDSTHCSFVQSRTIPSASAIRALKWNSCYGICIAGGVRLLSGYDPRADKVTFRTPFQDYRGIRSISSDGTHVTFCTASGLIAFTDLRLPLLFPIGDTPKTHQNRQSTSRPILHRNSHSYQLLGGYVRPTEFYTAHFPGLPVEQAIFTHAYDPTGTRLFVGGGPALEALDGCQAAMLY